MKAFAILFLTVLSLACQDKKEDKSKEGPNTVNVENVEGSVPDTTSGGSAQSSAVSRCRRRLSTVDRVTTIPEE